MEQQEACRLSMKQSERRMPLSTRGHALAYNCNAVVVLLACVAATGSRTGRRVRRGDLSAGAHCGTRMRAVPSSDSYLLHVYLSLVVAGLSPHETTSEANNYYS